MRNLRSLAVSLVVLSAAVASATSYSTAYSFIDATYTASSGMRLDGVFGEQYEYFFGGSIDNPGTYLVYDYSTGMEADPSLYKAQVNGSSTHLRDGNRFVMSATASASLSNSVHDLGLMKTYGYRYFLDFTNTTGTDATITFDMDLQRSHYGRVTGAAYDWSTGFGEYAETDTYGDSGDLSDYSTFDGNFRGDDTFDAGASSFNGHYAFNLTRTMTLGAGQSTRYEIYASSRTSLNNINPVPEPASLAALGVGALGLLRRRRR